MLIYLKDGRAKLSIDDSTYDAAPGELFVLRPGQSYSATLSTEKGIVICAHFDLFLRNDAEWLNVPFLERTKITKEQVEELYKEAEKVKMDMDLPVRLGVRSSAVVEEYMYGIVDARKEPEPFGEMRARGYFLLLWSYLLNEHKLVKDPENTELLERYREIKEYINAHYTEPISLESLGEEFAISPYHLQKTYKRIFGTTPFRDITMLRIAGAKRLLAETDMKLGEISEMLGFGSLYAFGRTFAREEGMNPRDYRKYTHRIKLAELRNKTFRQRR